MNFLLLKKVRVVVSLLFFLLITFLFVDFGNRLSAALINGILYLQFVPSIIKFLQLFSLASLGFIIILIITLFFGRIYCSTVCPLGTLQDIVSFFSKKVRRKKNYPKQKRHTFLQAGILLLVLVFLFSGSMMMLGFLDPYSVFGKIFSNLFRPAYYLANNVISWLTDLAELHIIYPIQYKSFNLFSVIISLIIFAFVLFLSWRYGRLYCNSVCPVGTVLGFVSRFAMFKIKLDDSRCTSCGICGANCKAGCIDTKAKEVDFSRCVGCLNCLTVCAGNGVVFTYLNKNNEPIVETGERRKFLQYTGGFLIALASFPLNTISQVVKTEKKPVVKEHPVTPPGSLSIDHFTRNCTSCQLCVSICPTQVLQPSLLAYGLNGIFQPTMDYQTSFCNFDCVICSDVCPTGAILPITAETKKLTQLGRSFFIKENCVVYTHETACGACSEHCPTKAVNMVFYKDKLTIPEVNNKICVGCGACEYACPTSPKSIYVDGQAVHQTAEKPAETKSEQPVQKEEDFPF